MALKGKLSEMGLSDIVQVACKGKNQACLIVQSQGQEGNLFFENGQIVHATLDSEEGEGVIYAQTTDEFEQAITQFEANNIVVNTRQKVLSLSWANIARQLEHIYEQLSRRT